MHSCEFGVTGKHSPPKADIAIVGIAPGKNEVKQGIPFVGESGKLLDAVLKSAGIAREDVLLTNLLCWWKNDPDESDIAECWPRLVQELKERGVKVVFALGNKPISALTDMPAGKVRHLAVRNVEIGCWVIGTWHPSAALRTQNDDMVTDLLRDLRKAELYVNGVDPSVEYNVVHSGWAARQLLNWYSLNCETLTLDVENPNQELACIGIKGDNEKVNVLTKEALTDITVEDWLKIKHKHWVFHNGMYDVEQLNKWWGVRLPIGDDTLLLSYALDMRGGGDDDTYGKGYHGLKRLAGEYCGAEMYGINAAKWPESEKEWNELYQYNARDVEYTYRLYQYLQPKVIEHGTYNVYRDLLLPAAEVLLSSKVIGVPIDVKVMLNIAKDWINEFEQKYAHIQELAQREGWDELNPNSPQQLSKFLYETLKLRKPNTRSMSATRTDKEALEQLEHDFVQELRDYRRVDKMLNTYVFGIERALDDNHRIHPVPMLHGTRTGRLSYNNPPIQTIPRGFMVGEEYGRIRSMFGGREGYSVFAADYEQAELWTAVMYSGDEQMKADLMEGDFHSRATEAMFEVDKEDYDADTWRSMREDSKRVTFGVMYGIGARTLSETDLKHYSRGQCQQFINAWYDRYKGVREWGLKQRELILSEGTQWTLSGRRFEYPSSLNYDQLNKAMNYPIQSTSHDVLLCAYIELQPLMEEIGGTIWFETHDALMGEVPNDVVELATSIIRVYMTKPRFGLYYGIPVEIKWGNNWNNVK